MMGRKLKTGLKYQNKIKHISDIDHHILHFFPFLQDNLFRNVKHEEQLFTDKVS